MAAFTIDPYAEMTPDQLRQKCRALGVEVMKWQMIALNLDAGGREALTDEARAAVARLREAYSD